MSEPVYQAPEGLRALVALQVHKLGLTRTRVSEAAVAWVERSAFHNKWIPLGALRTVARCPTDSCSGAEVVAEGHDFLCGMCGTEAAVDWSEL